MRQSRMVDMASTTPSAWSHALPDKQQIVCADRAPDPNPSSKSMNNSLLEGRLSERELSAFLGFFPLRVPPRAANLLLLLLRKGNALSQAGRPKRKTMSTSRLLVAAVAVVAMSAAVSAQRPRPWPGPSPYPSPRRSAPELNPATATTALALLTGCILVIRGRKR